MSKLSGLQRQPYCLPCWICLKFNCCSQTSAPTFHLEQKVKRRGISVFHLPNFGNHWTAHLPMWSNFCLKTWKTLAFNVDQNSNLQHITACLKSARLISVTTSRPHFGLPLAQWPARHLCISNVSTVRLAFNFERPKPQNPTWTPHIYNDITTQVWWRYIYINSCHRNLTSDSCSTAS